MNYFKLFIMVITIVGIIYLFGKVNHLINDYKKITIQRTELINSSDRIIQNDK